MHFRVKNTLKNNHHNTLKHLFFITFFFLYQYHPNYDLNIIGFPEASNKTYFASFQSYTIILVSNVKA